MIEKMAVLFLIVMAFFTGESPPVALDGDVLLASRDGKLQRGRVSSTPGAQSQPLRHNLLSTIGSLCSR